MLNDAWLLDDFEEAAPEAREEAALEAEPKLAEEEAALKATEEAAVEAEPKPAMGQMTTVMAGLMKPLRPPWESNAVLPAERACLSVV